MGCKLGAGVSDTAAEQQLEDTHRIRTTTFKFSRASDPPDPDVAAAAIVKRFARRASSEIGHADTMAATAVQVLFPCQVWPEVAATM